MSLLLDDDSLDSELDSDELELLKELSELDDSEELE